MHFLNHIDLNTWVSTLGYLGLAGIVFAETGLFFCFFLPGDSLLFTAGLLASRDVFHITLLITILVVVAFLGYLLGYWFGHRLGNWLSHRKDNWYFKKAYLKRAHVFYDKYGRNALLIGRLVPVVRTFVPIVAGMVKMSYGSYCLFNFLGAFLWGAGVTLLGYYLGAILPQANEYLLWVVVVIIFFSILPGVVQWWRKTFGVH